MLFASSFIWQSIADESRQTVVLAGLKLMMLIRVSLRRLLMQNFIPQLSFTSLVASCIGCKNVFNNAGHLLSQIATDGGARNVGMYKGRPQL